MRIPAAQSARRARRAADILWTRATAWHGGELALFHDFVPPPGGGGHQFLRALVAELEQRGVNVDVNRVSRDTRACLVNSFNFDPGRLRRLLRPGVRVVHRVDGPVSIYRDRDDGTDRHVAELNRQFADATIFQSRYSLERHRDLGIELVAPEVVPNATDPAIFHPRERAAFDPNRKIRLITTSWSDNPNKGAPLIRELERRLDWSRYEYTFVGRTAVEFERIQVVPPLPPAAVADLLRRSDVFVTPSRHEACSNALLEALSCGLPALYVNSGSHAEFVGEAGFAFDSVEEIPTLLDRLVDEYEERRARISVLSLAEIASRYLSVLGFGP